MKPSGGNIFFSFIPEVVPNFPMSRLHALCKYNCIILYTSPKTNLTRRTAFASFKNEADLNNPKMHQLLHFITNTQP